VQLMRIQALRSSRYGAHIIVEFGRRMFLLVW
jgi:hypothetical protein